MQEFVFMRVVLLVLLTTGRVLALTCDKITPCKCKMSDGSGIVDLTSLQGSGGNPRFKDVPGTETPEPLKYSWNPCEPFDEGGEYGCSQVAVCQIYSFTEVSGGSQASAKFAVNGRKLSVAYSQTYTTSVVDLLCDKTAVQPIFKAIGDPQSTNIIQLSLQHACSCPGVCDDSGIIGSSSGGTISVGTILIIVVLVLLPLYLVLGMLYKIKIKHESGLKILPNIEFWLALPEYIKDGFVFTFRCIFRRGEYSKI